MTRLRLNTDKAILKSSAEVAVSTTRMNNFPSGIEILGSKQLRYRLVYDRVFSLGGYLEAASKQPLRNQDNRGDVETRIQGGVFRYWTQDITASLLRP